VLLTAAGDWFELSGWWCRAGGYVLDGLRIGVSFVLLEVVVGLLAYGKVWGFLSLGTDHRAVAAPWLRVLFVDPGSLALGAVAVLRGAHGSGDALLASVGALVPGALTLVVYLWPLGSERNQTLIDKSAGSVVVNGDRLGAAAYLGAPHGG